MRGDAAESGIDAEVAWRGRDHLADRRGVVEHVAELAVQARGVERVRARQRRLLADGEEQLHVHRRTLPPDAPR